MPKVPFDLDTHGIADMLKTLREIVRQTFKGERFENHALDLTALPELVAYRELLVEVAKGLWRRNNPRRERLPANFDESFVLTFSEIQPGSACVPLLREINESENERLFPEPDEFDEAVELTDAAIRDVGEDQPLPKEFPAGCLWAFDGYGKTLRADESIEHRLPASEKPATYSLRIRKRLLDFAQGAYEDTIDLLGTVTMARVKSPRMTLTLDDGRDVEGVFRPEDEELVTTALKEHLKVKLRVRGRATFSPSGSIQRIVEAWEVSQVRGETAMVEGTTPIWRVFENIAKTIPDELLATLPADGASHHDHYIYASPKEP